MNGSIVIKRTRLLSLIEDMKCMLFHGVNMSEGARDVVRGQLIALEMILDGEYSDYDWDSEMQKVFEMQHALGYLANSLPILEAVGVE